MRSGSALRSVMLLVQSSHMLQSATVCMPVCISVCLLACQFQLVCLSVCMFCTRKWPQFDTGTAARLR